MSVSRRTIVQLRELQILKPQVRWSEFLLNKSVKGPVQKTHMVPGWGICRATCFYCWSSAEPETVEPSPKARKDQPRQHGKTCTFHAAQTRRTRSFPQVRSADQLESGQKWQTNNFIKAKGGTSVCDRDKIKKQTDRPGSGSEPFNCSLNSNNNPENDQHHFCYYQSLLSDVFSACLDKNPLINLRKPSRTVINIPNKGQKVRV